MKHPFTKFFAILCFLGYLNQGIAQPAFSSMDVFELEWVTSPQISPDGKQIVYVRNGMDIMQDKRQSRIWLIGTDGEGHQKLSSHDRNEGNPIWGPKGQRIAFTASTEAGAELFVYWANSGKIARLSQIPASPGGLSWSPDGKWLAFSMFVKGKELSLVSPPKKPKGAKWAEAPRITTRLKHEADGAGKLKPGFKHIFIIPADGGTARQITSGDFNHGSPTWSKDGKHLFFSSNRVADWEYKFRNSEIYKVAIADGKITSLTDRNGPDHSIALSPDGQQLAYLGFDDKMQAYQLTHLYVMNTDGGGKKRIPLQLDRSVSSPVWANDGKGIYFLYDDRGNTKIGYTTLQGQHSLVCGDVGGTSIGRPYGGGSFSISGQDEIAFTHSTPYHPAELAVAAKGKPVRMVHSLNDDLLAQRKLGKVEEIWYKSSFDGRDIQGWIVYPPHYESGKTYPLLVENHGGPISNYGDRFSPEIQLFATAGYVVFYPNPRGSTGYGRRIWQFTLP